MALFGGQRDVSLLRRLNREVMKNIISQKCAYYKYDLERTKPNLYGEVVEKRIFKEPILVYALVRRKNQEHPTDEKGVDFKWDIRFSFLRDDLVDLNLVPEVGDIIMYNEGYWEVDNVDENKFFFGKDPDYPYDNISDNLSKFGYNLSIICDCNYIVADKLDIIKTR